LLTFITLTGTKVEEFLRADPFHLLK
jgi:hypothetical protein